MPQGYDGESDDRESSEVSKEAIIRLLRRMCVSEGVLVGGKPVVEYLVEARGGDSAAHIVR